MNGKYVSQNKSTIGRFINALAAAIAKEPILPKIIVIIPDDDLIKLFMELEQGFSRSIGKVIDHIMNNFDRLISANKDYLEAKSKKQDYPHMLWIQAPYHDNFANNTERSKFNQSLVRMAKYHQNTSALELKKIWNHSDSNLYVREARRYTTRGYAAYWEAIDKTVKFCDTIVLKKPEHKKKKQPFKFNGNLDHYHWQQHSPAKFKNNMKSGNGKRKLPRPPEVKK